MELFDLQIFAGEEAPAGAPDRGVPEDASAAENESESKNKAADPEEKPGSETDKEKKEPDGGGEKKGEGRPAAGSDGERLLRSVETALNEKLKNARVKEIIDDWEKSGEELRAIYPGFDFRKELKENDQFRELIKAGVSVRRAYEAANLEKILGSALRYAAVTAGKKTAGSVMSQQGRAQENPVLDRASSLTRKDVGSLTKSDILKILDEVSRGATIKF